MNKTQQTYLAVFVFSLFLTQLSCQRRSSEWKPGHNFKTQIIVSRSFKTEFQQVELTGITDSRTLAGNVADFYFAPSNAHGTLVGNSPLARFVKDSSGVYIPVDNVSLQMVTIYYHLQQLKKLEIEATGQPSIVTWPRKIALGVRINDAPEMKFDNAFYSANVDALFFVPYSDKSLPIAINSGIIGHEHFHSYFAYQVTNPLTQEGQLPSDGVKDLKSAKASQQLYDLYVLRSLNEGLADVWGWIYSEDPDFVALSLPRAQNSRNLDVKNSERLKSETSLSQEVDSFMSYCPSRGFNPNACAMQFSYVNGTVLARTLRAFAELRKQSTQEADQNIRKLMAQKILSLLSELRKSFERGEKPTLDRVLILWKAQFESLSPLECKLLQDNLSSSGELTCGSSEFAQ